MHNSNKKKCQKAPNAKILFLIYYIFSTHRIFTFGFAGRVFTLSCMRPNFSRVRLTKIRGRTSAYQPFEKRKKSLRDSESLYVVQQKTHVRLISWSKPIRDSERGIPPLIGCGPDISVCVCAFTNASRVLLQSDREGGE